MVEDYQEFYKKESYRADRRERLRSDEREHRERTQQENLRTKQDFQRDREDRKLDQQDNINYRNNALKKQIHEEKLRQKEDIALATAEARLTGTVEAEQIRAKKELQLKRMEVEAKARFMRAEQQLYQEKKDIDFDDEVRRANLRGQEYALMRGFDRQNERALRSAEHNDKMDFMREHMKSLMLDKALAHKLEKNRMTHETDEKIRYAYAMAELKKKYGDLENADLEAIIKQMAPQWKAEQRGEFTQEEADIIEGRKSILDEEIETEQRKGQYLKFKLKN